ncbi:hypothetical protein ACHAW6_000953 [Cyclotella cf. meneghiniana]
MHTPPIQTSLSCLALWQEVYDVPDNIFTDQTKKIPTRSQCGNKYVMVMVDIDSNAILLKPLMSKKDPELI